MQDRYVGDVGDYGKYALLRSLTLARSGNRLRLGVVWYRYPDEGHNGDGRHTAYLGSETFASLDPELHRTLGALVASGRRTIIDVQTSGLLPNDTEYHSDQAAGLDGEGTVTARRIAHRSLWFRQAAAATASADLVFLDPDNGIASPITPAGGPRIGKYVFLSEIVEFWERGKSLVVYHHLNRTASNVVQVAALERRIRGVLGDPALLYPLILRRGSCRVFWIIGQERHVGTLNTGIAGFLSAGWSEHCTVPEGDLGSPTRSGAPSFPRPRRAETLKTEIVDC